MKTLQVQLMFNNGYQVGPFTIEITRDRFIEEFSSADKQFIIGDFVINNKDNVYCYSFSERDLEEEARLKAEQEAKMREKTNEEVIEEYVEPIDDQLSTN